MISERAYEQLRDRIVTLRLAPGTVLREDELMRELEIGRTPLREAVKRLALENLVAVQPRIGTYVTSHPLAGHEEVHAAIDGSQLEVLASTGHLSTLEEPDAVAASLARWLAW